MQWKILKPANVNIPATLGFCLVYGRETYGIAAKYPTAWAAWNAAKYKHTDQNFPSEAGVAVPVFFSGAGGNGHVVIHDNGKFYSSPYLKSQGNNRVVLNSIAEVEQHYGVKYAGWSEDIDGVRVVEQVADPAPAPTVAIPTGFTAKKGTAKVIVDRLNVRRAPNTSPSNKPVAQYEKGEAFTYDSWGRANGYVWLSYVGNSGIRDYISEGPDDGNPKNVYVTGGVN